jgi:endonuclease/exonuclease/phosphatase family metal-dependent hydrolase
MDRIDVEWDREEPIVWGGDFNQELRDLTPERKALHYRLAGTTRGIERLRGAFDLFGLTPLTEASEHFDPASPAIDHLAVTSRLARDRAGVWRPHYRHGYELSDHAAYVADIRL